MTPTWMYTPSSYLSSLLPMNNLLPESVAAPTVDWCHFSTIARLYSPWAGRLSPFTALAMPSGGDLLCNSTRRNRPLSFLGCLFSSSPSLQPYRARLYTIIAYQPTNQQQYKAKSLPTHSAKRDTARRGLNWDSEKVTLRTTAVSHNSGHTREFITVLERCWNGRSL